VSHEVCNGRNASFTYKRWQFLVMFLAVEGSDGKSTCQVVGKSVDTVIDDNGAGQVPAEPGEILDEDVGPGEGPRAVLAVEPVGEELTLGVELPNALISVYFLNHANYRSGLATMEFGYLPRRR
jgi:hypothetical protein